MDPVTELLHQLRTRGGALLIAGHIEDVEVEEIRVEIMRQRDLQDPELVHEQLVVSLDTLETILRWNQDGRKGVRRP